MFKSILLNTFMLNSLSISLNIGPRPVVRVVTPVLNNIVHLDDMYKIILYSYIIYHILCHASCNVKYPKMLK